MKAWMRKIVVRLIADNGANRQTILTFGEDDDNLAMSITGSKYLSPMKDEFVVAIKNVPTDSAEVSVLSIRDIAFRYITIEAGYVDATMQIFNGYIVYISSKEEDNGKTTTMTIVCSGSYTYNALRGKTFTLRKGTDYKTALMFAAKMSGIPQHQISLTDTLRFKRLQKDTTFDGSIMSILIELQNQDKNLFVHCDFTSQTKFQIWDAVTYTPRFFELTADNIILTNGFPQVEDQGVRFTCLPTFNFIPGDEVIFNDASFINRSIESLSSYQSSPYPDVFVGAVSPLETDSDRIKEIESVKGHYFIKELQYKLENRGQAYEIQLKCYAKSLYESLAQN